jgi:S-phase kinase-associated protein 1
MSVQLVAQDGQTFEVPKEITEMSVTVKNLLGDANDDSTPIPLPNISGKILAKVIEWLKQKHEHPDPPLDEKARFKASRKTDNIPAWDQEFFKVDVDTLLGIIVAANYLDIPGLLEVGIKTLAHSIKGKEPAEIRAFFGIHREFTPEEEEQFYNENPWAKEPKKTEKVAE